MISGEYLSIFAIMMAVLLLIVGIAFAKLINLNTASEQAAFERDAYVLSHSLNRLLVCGEGCTVNVHFSKKRLVYVNNSEVIIEDKNLGLRERAVAGFHASGFSDSANSSAINLTLHWGLLEVSPA